MEKTGIEFFKFPKDDQIRKQWERSIGQYRRKRAEDKFQIKSTTAIFEFYFKEKDNRVNPGRRKKILNQVMILKIFLF